MQSRFDDLQSKIQSVEDDEVRRVGELNTTLNLANERIGSSTQDVLLYTDIGAVLADAVYPPNGAPAAAGSDELARRIRGREVRLFDDRGGGIRIKFELWG